MSPTTIDGYKRISKNYFEPLNNLSVGKITNSAMQKFVNDLSLRLSAKSVSNIYGLAVSVIYATEPSRRFNVRLPQKQKVYRDLPEPRLIMQAVKGTDVELAVLLAIWLSLRMSEIRGIRKKYDISEDGVLTINNVMVHTENGEILKSQTKTYESKRRLRLPQYLINLIDKTDTEFLVPFTISMIEKKFAKALDAAGVPHIRFHDLRHLNASVMLSLGIPDKYAMERGGWSSTGVLKGVYQHTFSKERQEIDRKIDDYFNSICHEI